jgi:hypothetical protein
VALLGLFALSAPQTAVADVITTFDVSGSFDISPAPPLTFDAGSRVTIDATTGLASDAYLSLTSGATTITFKGMPGATDTSTEYLWEGCSGSIGFCFPGVLRFDNTTGTGFEGFVGGDLTGELYCSHCFTGSPSNAIEAIILTPVPEPSSVALLAGAVVAFAFAGTVRRKRKAARELGHQTLESDS